MAQFLPIALVAAVIFGICYLVDKAFSKLFGIVKCSRSSPGNTLRGIFGYPYLQMSTLR